MSPYSNGLLLTVITPVVLAGVLYSIFLNDSGQNAIYCTPKNGRVYTSTESEFADQPEYASCFAISGDKFSKVWKRRQDVPEKLQGSIVDISGRVIPGVWDGHGKLSSMLV